MELHIGVSKIRKYASSDSGDSLEMIERPSGGLSVVLVDGQRSGKSAKRISNLVVRKVVSLLAEGVRDGAAARAASDYLLHHRAGKVSATLNILSVDLASNTLVITRNNPAPVYIAHGHEIEALDEKSKAVGIHRDTRPVITQMPLDLGLTVLVFTDGIPHAGERYGTPMDIPAVFGKLLDDALSAQAMADKMLETAVKLDKGRPTDDVSVVVLRVRDRDGDEVRRMSVRLPLGH